MSGAIRIMEPEVVTGAAARLNLFPGRYLSERELTLLQSYVDDRLMPLLATLRPGIVSGLEVRSERQGANTAFSIQPGVAVAAGGQQIRLLTPLRMEWSDFLELVRRQNGPALLDGLYWLTLHSEVQRRDAAPPSDPATRTEADPLRQLRLETVTMPGLHLVSASPDLLAMPQSRAANRVCVMYLQQSPLAGVDGVPVALVKVAGNQPEWIDPWAGRYLAEPAAEYRTFLAHTAQQVDAWMAAGRAGDQAAPLADLLQIDYLPAAGILPPQLLQDPAGNPPRLLFAPGDLQVELAAIPAATVAAAIEAELARGVVDLVHRTGDRIRLLLAISDRDYTPQLLDLPQRDTALEDKLAALQDAAALAYYDWLQQWQLLFRDLAPEQRQRLQAPPEESPPGKSGDFLSSLVSQRLAALGGDAGRLPEPYASHLAHPHPLPNPSARELPVPEEKLFARREELAGLIRQSEKDLDESYQLLNELDDYLTLQRQHLDSVTLSFSALAGGVPGDGLGSSMVRWSSAASFVPDTTAKG